MTTTIATNPMNGLFDFGPVDSNDIRLSFEGLAVRRNEDYYIYDTEEKQLQQVFNFMTIQTGQPMAWKIPTKVERLLPGDLFQYNNTLYYVINNEVSEKNCIATFNMTTHRNSSLNVAQNPLGMRMVTKISTLADSFDDDMMPLLMMGGMGGQQVDGQAGGMNPLMMMMLMKDKGEGKGKIDPMMLMMMSGGMGGQGGQDMGMLPLMMLMKDGDDKSDMKNMMMMAMMSGGMGNQPGGQAGGMNPMMAMMMMKNL